MCRDGQRVGPAARRRRQSRWWGGAQGAAVSSSTGLPRGGQAPPLGEGRSGARLLAEAPDGWRR
jgi:hypothetical protein